jgi:ribonucleoside-diphosphate reductase alpha chain
MVTSVIDYVFRVLALEYLGDDAYCQVKPESLDRVLSVTESADEARAFGEAPDAMGRPAARIESIAPEGAEAPQHARPSAGQPAGPGVIGVTGVTGISGIPGLPGISGISGIPGVPGLPGVAPQLSAAAMDKQLSTMMGDAPFCDVCGHLTVRNGTCYKCLNCGNSMGCS